MDPLTWIAVAQAVVAGVSTVYNYFAGQSQLAQANQRLQKQRGFVDQAYQDNVTDLANQNHQAQMGVDQMAAKTSAAGAQAGVLGPDVSDRVEASANEAENQVDLQYASRTAQLNNSYAQQTNQLDETAQNIREKGDQLGLDALGGLIGVGFSAAGAMVKGGMFDSKADTSGAAVEAQRYAGIGAGVGIPGTGSGGYTPAMPGAPDYSSMYGVNMGTVQNADPSSYLSFMPGRRTRGGNAW